MVRLTYLSDHLSRKELFIQFSAFFFVTCLFVYKVFTCMYPFSFLNNCISFCSLRIFYLTKIQRPHVSIFETCESYSFLKKEYDDSYSGVVVS